MEPIMAGIIAEWLGFVYEADKINNIYKIEWHWKTMVAQMGCIYVYVLCYFHFWDVGK